MLKLLSVLFLILFIASFFACGEETTPGTSTNTGSATRVVKGTVPQGSGVVKVIAIDSKKSKVETTPDTSGNWSLTLPRNKTYSIFLQKPVSKATVPFILSKKKLFQNFSFGPNGYLKKGYTGNEMVPVILDQQDYQDSSFECTEGANHDNSDIDLGSCDADLSSGMDVFIATNDPDLYIDQDGDGLVDETDPDDDEDGLSDLSDYDDDGDGVGDDWLWIDADGDGIWDWDDSDVPGADTADSDSDGIIDDWDWDDDNDGIDDVSDTDEDGDGTLDTTEDSDGDGCPDAFEDFDNMDDVDSDGIPDDWDDDDDGDGTMDWDDTDNDNDGLLDAQDPNPTDPDSDNDGTVDGSDSTWG